MKKKKKVWGIVDYKKKFFHLMKIRLFNESIFIEQTTFLEGV